MFADVRDALAEDVRLLLHWLLSVTASDTCPKHQGRQRQAITIRAIANHIALRATNVGSAPGRQQQSECRAESAKGYAAVSCAGNWMFADFAAVVAPGTQSSSASRA